MKKPQYEAVRLYCPLLGKRMYYIRCYSNRIHFDYLCDEFKTVLLFKCKKDADSKIAELKKALKESKS